MNRDCIWLAIITLSASVTILGCDNGPTVVGSGVPKSETRSTADFNSVSIYGVGSLKIQIGSPASLKITADDNLVPFVKSDVRNGVLNIGVGNGSYTWNGFPQMELTVPELNSVMLAGQTQVAVAGLQQAKFSVTTSGQNAVSLLGTVENLVLSLEGQSTCDASMVSAKTALVRSATKNVQCTYLLNATDTISGEIGGTSVLEYFETPTLSVKTTDQASIKRRE